MNPLIILTAIVMCTGSMEPSYSCGDRVILEQDFNLTVGDVYVYKMSYYNGIYNRIDSKLIMHRLVAYNETSAIFKADMGLYNESIDVDNIIYKVGAKI